MPISKIKIEDKEEEQERFEKDLFNLLEGPVALTVDEIIEKLSYHNLSEKDKEKIKNLLLWFDDEQFDYELQLQLYVSRGEIYYYIHCN